MKAALVYQAGIANVFQVDIHSHAPEGRNARRFFQGPFALAVEFARGMATSGWEFEVMACNRPGDIANEKWSWTLDDHPFSDKFVRDIGKNTPPMFRVVPV